MRRSSGALALPRAERLRRAGDFQAVFQRGNRVDRGPFVALWRPSPGERKVGFAVSRQLRTAVRRNRVRRRLREAYRRQHGECPRDLSIVFVGRPTVSSMVFGDLLDEMSAALRLIGQRAAAPGAPAEARR
jgi:ribonuclease P protein component